MFFKVLLYVVLLVYNNECKIGNVTFHNYCYTYSSNFLPNILNLNPPKGESIFFIESSCRQDRQGYVLFTPRQACSVESAARAHPDKKIYVLVTSLGRTDFEKANRSSAFSALKVYKNIKFCHLNYIQYLKNSPISYEQANPESSNEMISAYKVIEPLRLLTLWRYGGIYLDLDVIVLKPLKDLATNFLGELDKSSVGDAIMGFSHKSEGHAYLRKCLSRLGSTGVFNENGKIEFCTIMKCYKTICNTADWSDANTPKHCQHLILYPPDFFYPVHYLEWTRHFDESQMLEIFGRVQQSYAVHFWNKFSNHLRFMINSSFPYAIFAKKYCPEVVKIAREYM